MPALKEEHIFIPVENLQLVQIKKWKMWKPGTVDVAINFIGPGLYDKDWETYINNFLLKRGQSPSGIVAAVEGKDIVF